MDSLAGGDGAAVRLRYGLGQRPLILYAGVLDEFQRLDLLFEAMKEVATKEPEANLLIVVTIPCARHLDRLHRATKELGVSERVIFTEPQPLSAIPDFLAACDLAVLPRPQAPGFPMKLLNYMAAERPCVLFASSASTGLVHGLNAYLAQPDTSAALARNFGAAPRQVAAPTAGQKRPPAGPFATRSPDRSRTVVCQLFPHAGVREKMMTRVFMIGWDGATFDLIRPWVAEGKLPTIARLMTAGAHGQLCSTLPPMTFPAWTSFMTGVNPGKHGIYDFTRPRPGRYELEFVNGGQRRAPSFWQILSQAGRRVASISLPCTYPPEPVNGVMISGFDAPGLGGSGAHVDARGMHPPELYQELCQNVGRHPIDSIVSDIARGHPEAGLEKSLETIRQKTATAKYLLKRGEWDCFMILFGESDGIAHHYWKYMDRDSPLFEEHPAKLEDSILKVYQELDRQTAELIELLPEDANVLMMSDHGFGGIGDWLLYPNCWLREQGFLRFRGGAAHWRSRLLESAKLRAVALLPGWLKHALYRLSPAGLGGFESPCAIR